MSGNRHVPTRAVQTAVKGREAEILDALQIDWPGGQRPITCPYPGHADNNPSWRWDEKKACAFCSCIEKAHSIFDVLAAKEGIDFEAAKIRVAQILGRENLIRDGGPAKNDHFPGIDAESLLNPPAENCEDRLPRAYLAYRLSVPGEQVLMPSTRAVGLKSLGYYDPPAKESKAKPKRAGEYPCAIFGTVSADGRTHAHRIYLAPAGAGKAELGNTA